MTATAGDYFKEQLLAPENAGAYWTIKLVTGREIFSKIDPEATPTNTPVVALRALGKGEHPTYLNLDQAVTIRRAEDLTEEE